MAASSRTSWSGPRSKNCRFSGIRFIVFCCRLGAILVPVSSRSVRVSGVPQPNQRRLFRHHHPGPGLCRLAGLQSERDEARRHQRLDRFQASPRVSALRPRTQRALYIMTVLCLGAAYCSAAGSFASRAGRVLIAIRDSEKRVVFSGYTPAKYKLFVFVVAAGLAGLAGMLYVPQVGIITPAQIGVLPSLEMVIWVAVGGRGTLVGAIVGAVAVNYGRSVFTNYFPEAWPFILGGLFVRRGAAVSRRAGRHDPEREELLTERKAGEGKPPVPDRRRKWRRSGA